MGLGTSKNLGLGSLNRELTPYERIIRELSDRIVEAQAPIRILDGIKWDPSIQEAFFKGKFKKQPAVDRDYYQGRTLNFDPSLKRQQFSEIERDIVQKLGQFSPVGKIMREMCQEYRTVVRMLEARGTAEFVSISRELYGSASDVFHAGDPTLATFGQMMSDALSNIQRSKIFKEEEKNISGEEAVKKLQERVNQIFGENVVQVILSDGIIADAAAGADYIKIRKEAWFNERTLRNLEVHEGWVHIATTLNGLNQPICTFLSKGPPSSTITQEGLAILMEVIAFASYPDRIQRITNRIRAVHLAEEGASFIEVFHFFRDYGSSEISCYNDTVRVFRGSLPTGGPFTKDLSYSKGFILVYNYIQLAVHKGMLNRIPLLFCGKIALEDMRTLADLVQEGIVVPPKFCPPQFEDLSALTAWMCYSSFLNNLSLQRIEADYSGIL